MPNVSTCNLCGSSVLDVVFKENIAQVHQIVRCRNCKLMYAFPVHKRKFDIYAAKKNEPTLKMDDPTILHAFTKLPDYQIIPIELQKYKPLKGRILDVGCYVGAFLHFMQREDWDVTGVEPDARAVKFARESLGLTILDIPLESLDTALYYNNFDVVTMLHMIEHVDDPASMLGVALSVLKTKGILVVETPTHDSLMFKILGRRERSVSCKWAHFLLYRRDFI